MLFNPFKRIHQNPNGRLFAFGDVHGDLKTLKQLLEEIQFDPIVDQAVFVGDLADRGESSLETLEYVLDEPHFHIVAGNHEHLLYEYINGRQALPKDILDYWLKNDGGWIKQHDNDVLTTVTKKLNEQCYFLIEAVTSSGKRFGVTHAGYDIGSWYQEQNQYEDDYYGRVMWSRQRAEFPAESLAPVTGIDYTIHGHTIFESPTLKGNSIFLDTGGGCGGKLSALNLEQFGQQPVFDESSVYSI